MEAGNNSFVAAWGGMSDGEKGMEQQREQKAS